MTDDGFAPGEIARATYAIYLNAACCAAWAVLNAIGARVLEAPRLLGLSASALLMIGCWVFALRDLRAGRLQRGVLNYVVTGLVLLLAMSLSVPELAGLFAFATFIFLAFGLSYADRRSTGWIVALTLAVAGAMLVTSFALGWTSGIDPDLLRWTKLIGMTMALAINAVEFTALRATLEARADRLRASEARKGAFLDGALDAIVMMDAAGAIVEINPAGERMFGYARADAIGRSLAEAIIPPELRSKHADGLARHLATGGSQVLGRRVELEAMRRDGGRFPAEIAIVRPDDDGPPIFIGYIRDLTVQKEAEDARALWIHALEQTAFGISVSDLDSRRMLRVNAAYAQLVQYPPDELSGMSGDALIAPEAREDLAAIGVVLRREGRATFGLRLRRRDGASVPVLVSSSSVVTPSGARLLISTIVDLTERERLERERRAAADRLALVANATHEFASAAGDVDALFALVAQRLSEAVGDGCVVRLISEDGAWVEPSATYYHKDASTLRDAGGLVGQERQRVGEGLAGRVATSGEAVILPTIDLAKLEGAVSPAYHALFRRLEVTSVMALPLRSHGRTTGVISMLRSKPSAPYGVDDLRLAQDIADRAGLAIDNARLVATLEERVRERTAELERANQELEAFSYSVSHDLRGPLRAIDGYSRALFDDYQDKLDRDAARYLGRIRAGTQRMGKLIDDLLDLSRIGRRPLQISTVDVSRIAGEVVAELRQRDPAREVAVEIARDLTATADARLVTILLENLLGNAWKFTAKSSPARVQVGVQQGVFYVRDNGAGFDMAFASKLFVPFQRLHSAEEFAGEGIGLATVARIVAHHRGKIWADAKVGEGATIFFTLGEAS